MEILTLDLFNLGDSQILENIHENFNETNKPDKSRKCQLMDFHPISPVSLSDVL